MAERPSAPAGFQILTSACGHHCLVATSMDVRTVQHCGCPECHNGPAPRNVAEKVKRP